MSAAILLSNGELVNPFNIQVMPPRHVFTRALAMLNRYTGHTMRPYSVAEHSILLATHPLVIEAGLQRTALLHDFNEAITNDLPRPFKSVLPEFTKFEEVVQSQIFAHYNEPWENMERFTTFDHRICCDEMAQLFNPPVAAWMEPLGVTLGEDLPWTHHYQHLDYLCELVGIN